MKRLFLLSALILSFVVAAATPDAEARRVRVVHRGPRGVVRVSASFPVRRALPHVVVRTPLVAFRVVPRVYLPAVTFGAVVLATAPARDGVVWEDSEELEKDDDWTEFGFNVDKRGTALLFEIEDGPAQVSFAEVVFDNGETQVVDFADGQHKLGTYSLLDFKDGRKVDHVRVVAKASGKETEISVRLIA